MSYRLTLLEMVQKCLTATNSDSVNDISDTEESLMVVDIIEDTYYELMFQSEWDHLKTPVQLTGLGDASYPTTFTVADTIDEIHKFMYDVRENATDALNYTEMVYRDPIAFTKMLMSRTSTDSTIDALTVKDSSVPLLVFNDRKPTYYTSYDENYITLDAYDSSLESTLQTSKNLAYCTVMPTFDSTSNTFVPVCPAKMFPALLAEAKRACFYYLKDQAMPVDEKRAFRHTNILKQDGNRVHERRKRPKWGRGR